MADSETKFREIEGIYGEVVERLDATTKLFNEFKNSLVVDQGPNGTPNWTPNGSVSYHSSYRPSHHPSVPYPAPQCTQDVRHTSASHHLPSYTTHLSPCQPAPTAVARCPEVLNDTRQSLPPENCYIQLRPTERLNDGRVCSVRASGAGECLGLHQHNRSLGDSDADLSAQKVDVGAVEVLLLLADGYIQQCEGVPEQQENKAKLVKLRKKIILNRDVKPKAITKLMNYVQKIGTEVLKSCHRETSRTGDDDGGRASCHQRSKSITDSRRSGSPKVSSDDCCRVRCVNTVERDSAASLAVRQTKNALKPCLINGMEAVQVGQVIPLSMLPTRGPRQGSVDASTSPLSLTDNSASLLLSPDRSSYRLLNAGTSTSAVPLTDQALVDQYQAQSAAYLTAPMYDQVQYAVPQGILSQTAQLGVHSPRPSLAQPQPQSALSTPRRSSLHTPLLQKSLQQLRESVSQLPEESLTPAASYFSDHALPPVSYPYINSVLDQSSQQQQQDQQPQQPSQQQLEQQQQDQQLQQQSPQQLEQQQQEQQQADESESFMLSQLADEFPEVAALRETVQRLSMEDSRKASVVLEEQKNGSERSFITAQRVSEAPKPNQVHWLPGYLRPSEIDRYCEVERPNEVQTQGTQWQDRECPIHNSKKSDTSFCTSQEANNGLLQRLRKRSSMSNSASRSASISPNRSSSSSLARHQCDFSDDEDKPESIMDRLERKSLNIPEGTLVTDGMNVYYIMKPSDKDNRDSAEEVVVNIPIKGSNIVKPAGEAQRCPSCVRNRKKQRNFMSEGTQVSQRQVHLRDETDYDEVIKLAPVASAESQLDDDIDDSLLNEKKKAKSHSKIADFETCICSDCYPDKEKRSQKPLQKTLKVGSSERKASQDVPQFTLNLAEPTSSANLVPTSSSTHPAAGSTHPAAGSTHRVASSTPPVARSRHTVAITQKRSDEMIDAQNDVEIKNISISKIAKYTEPDIPPIPDAESHSNDPPDEFSDAASLLTLPITLVEPSLAELPSDIEGKVVPVSSVESIRKKECLQEIFRYLDTKSLTIASEVCKEWKLVARRPSLWKRLDISNERISSKFLQTISSWCTQVETISLQGLKTPKKKKSEDIRKFLAAVQGSLEKGLEAILKASNVNVTAISVSGCSNLFTDRLLWSISAYCPMLKRLAYVSAHCPAGKEALWGLGNGCRMLNTLLLPQMVPCKDPTRFDDDCCEVIGSAWPNLKAVCIGGEGLTANGLVILAKLCQDLKILELDKALPITKRIVQAMTYVGLQKLELVELNYTDISSEALKAFRDGCPKLARFSYEAAKPVKSQAALQDLKDEQAIKLFEEATEVVPKRPTTVPTPNDRIQQRHNPRHADYPVSQPSKQHQQNMENLRERLETMAKQPRYQATTQQETALALAKEEQEKSLESKLLATKQLNKETAQELMDKMRDRKERRLNVNTPSLSPSISINDHITPTKTQSKLDKLKENIRNSSSKSSKLTGYTSSIAPSISINDHSTTSKKLSSLEKWKEDIRNSNSRGAKTVGHTPNLSPAPSFNDYAVPTRTRSTHEKWKKDIRSSNPLGAKMLAQHQQKYRGKDIHHSSLEEQLTEQSDESESNAADTKG